MSPATSQIKQLLEFVIPSPPQIVVLRHACLMNRFTDADEPLQNPTTLLRVLPSNPPLLPSSPISSRCFYCRCLSNMPVLRSNFLRGGAGNFASIMSAENFASMMSHLCWATLTK